MQIVKGCAYRGTGSLESEVVGLNLGFCIRETRATGDFSVSLREGNLGGYRLEAPAWLQLRLLPLANDLRDPQIQTVGVSQVPLLRILCEWDTMSAVCVVTAQKPGGTTGRLTNALARA